MGEQRWCLVVDNDGRYFLCPVERRDDASAVFDSADDDGAYVEPSYLVGPLEGSINGDLTFELPVLDGQPVRA